MHVLIPLNASTLAMKLKVRLFRLFLFDQSLTESTFAGEGTPDTIDLSKATNLKKVTLRCPMGLARCGWVIMTLVTITPNHRDLQQISIYIPYAPDFTDDLGLIRQVEAAKPGMRWSDLDGFLVQLCSSGSISPKILCPRSKNTTQRVDDWARYLLPETAKKGTVELGGE